MSLRILVLFLLLSSCQKPDDQLPPPADGEVLLKMKSYHNEGYYMGGLGIGKQYNQLSVSSGYDVMAFTIPKQWHYD